MPNGSVSGQRVSRSDCRLQAAKLRSRELQSPPVCIQDVLRDCKAQARSATSLVETGATLEHAWQVTRLYAFAVIFDDDRRDGFIRCDPDESRGMASSVLDQIAEDFGEVGPVERDAIIVGDEVLECRSCPRGEYATQCRRSSLRAASRRWRWRWRPGRAPEPWPARARGRHGGPWTR